MLPKILLSTLLLFCMSCQENKKSERICIEETKRKMEKVYNIVKRYSYINKDFNASGAIIPDDIWKQHPCDGQYVFSSRKFIESSSIPMMVDWYSYKELGDYKLVLYQDGSIGKALPLEIAPLL